ncbi:hypothetical protein [Actinorugispora endophytica]|uniref:Uncharacterized protein n=1 Tax=Actinorugispora endophytica TaxID=1605990 RepID=A0A4R6V1L7_9ACTN|nr:hypothetical protein [Actinorugispora endophytica]TDQ53754.1 hypothetical protein EV190_103205 [Actinorugispora endophytica]
MRDVIRLLDAGASDAGGDSSFAQSALERLAHLYQASLDTPIKTEEMRAFKDQVVTLLKKGKNPSGLSLYSFECMVYAERGRLDGFQEACRRRSVLQILDDAFAPWDQVAPEPDREELEEIDETLREVSDEAPPVPEEDIPSWLPDSHWWWRAPRKQDMSQEERESRLNYDQYDGLETLG